MSEVVSFRPRPSWLRLVQPGPRGVIVQFPRAAMQRRLDQFLVEHLSRVAQSRRAQRPDYPNPWWTLPSS
jgi:hypothetical protein